MCADVALVVNLQVNVWEVSWRAVSKLVSFLQARISSSIGLLLLVFCCKTRKKIKRRNFLRRQDFGEREKRKGEGARRGGRFLLRVTISRFLPLRVLKSKITPLDFSQYSFRVLSLKKKCQEVLELAPRKDKNSLGPRPSMAILVS